jgi:bifunctional UDP-N-acetylglucosamine pyrophosphorylase / glucosamine-1-phosphate N-acetyltransferase
MDKIAGIILAAGKGTRMNGGQASEIPKVMFKINGEPIIKYSVELLKNAGVSRVVLVVGYHKETVMEYFGDKVEYAVQEDQLGTGHATLMAKGLLEGKSEAVAVFYGDNPLYLPETVKKLVDLYENPPAGGKPTIAMLSVIFNNPEFWAFGRLERNKNGDVVDIVEQKDCTPEQLKIQECNPGFYIFDAAWFWENCQKIQTNNVQKEYYLTDIVKLASDQRKKIVAMPVKEIGEALGINNPEQLEKAAQILRRRKHDI